MGGDGKVGDDDGQDHRRRQRRPETLGEPGPHEKTLRICRTTRSRRHREQPDTKEKDFLSTDQITESARQEQRSSKGNEIGINDPRKRCLRKVQIMLNRRQGHIDDGLIQGIHQHRKTNDDERNPAAPTVQHCAN